MTVTRRRHWGGEVREACSLLRRAKQMLASAPASALRTSELEGGTDVVRDVLAVAAFLDDSVSNPTLGTIFDRRAETPLNTMLTALAEAYGVEATFAGTTGTTGLNVPAVMSLAAEGRTLVVDRSCHVSVDAGVCLAGARPSYVVPAFDGARGVLLPPTADEVATSLDANRDATGVVITAPTYFGLMPDVRRIVEVCHRRGVPILIDEAHGPHFRFLETVGFPEAAEATGADIVTQSTHKMMSALNQGSLVHFNNRALASRYEAWQHAGFQSTSFSYPILLSIEYAVGQMVQRGASLWAGAVQLARRLRDGAAGIRGVKPLNESVVDGRRVRAIDPTRVTLNIVETGLSGYEVEAHLLAQDIVVEMATTDVVLFLVSPSTTREHIERTLWSLRRTLGDATRGIRQRAPSVPRLPELVLTPRDASCRRTHTRVQVADAVGRVSAETVSCYPPGQAILVAGERVTDEVVAYLRATTAMGGHLKRARDDGFQTIDVVNDEVRV